MRRSSCRSSSSATGSPTATATTAAVSSPSAEASEVSPERLRRGPTPQRSVQPSHSCRRRQFPSSGRSEDQRGQEQVPQIRGGRRQPRKVLPEAVYRDKNSVEFTRSLLSQTVSIAQIQSCNGPDFTLTQPNGRSDIRSSSN